MKKMFSAIAAVMLVLSMESCGDGRLVVSAGLNEPVYERPARPYDNYVWVDGDWYNNGGRYEYRHGYWSAPRGHRSWQAGTWTNTSNGYYWRRGRWH